MPSAELRGVPTLTQHIDDEGGGQLCGHSDHTSQLLGCAYPNTTTGSNKGVLRHTQPDQGTDDTTYGGGIQKRGHANTPHLYLPVPNTT